MSKKLCCRCHDEADFEHSPGDGRFKAYCDECFEIDYPEMAEVKNRARLAAAEFMRIARAQ